MTDLFIQLTKDVMSRDDDGILIVMVIKEDKFQTRSHFSHVARGGGVVWWRKGGGGGRVVGVLNICVLRFLASRPSFHFTLGQGSQKAARCPFKFFYTAPSPQHHHRHHFLLPVPPHSGRKDAYPRRQRSTTLTAVSACF